MDKTAIETRCHAKAKEIINKYFGDLIQETVYEQPEILDKKYTKELPFQIEQEYLAFLDKLKREIMPEDTRAIEEAYDDAKTITLWEKIEKSNHNDVAYFVGLIKQYSEELLDHMINDFLNLGETV